MYIRQFKRAGLAVICLATIVYGGNAYFWTGEAIGQPGNPENSWDVNANWDCDPFCVCLVGGPCYPHTTADDAMIPKALQPPWTVDLTTETIRDLKIQESVDFGTAGGTPTLTVDTLTIFGQAFNATTVTITGATIVTN